MLSFRWKPDLLTDLGPFLDLGNYFMKAMQEKNMGGGGGGVVVTMCYCLF